MSYSLKQAAAATGKTKTTILRAIQTAKLSATKDAMGAWQVDPAELHRVYPPIEEAAAGQTQRNASELYERLLTEKDQQIASLTEQLKAADEERRTTLRQLTALLTDQRPKARRWLPPAVIIGGHGVVARCRRVVVAVDRNPPGQPDSLTRHDS